MLTADGDGTHVVRDATGRALARTSLTLDAAPPRAELLIGLPGASPSAIATAAQTALAGMRVSTEDPDLGHALVGAGGVLVRNATVMSLQLASSPAGGSDARVLAWADAPAAARTPAALAVASVAAYPPEHPDHEPGDDDLDVAAAGIASILAGEAIGEFSPDCSGVVVDGAEVVAAVLITEVDADLALEWPGGTWIADVFVAPSHGGQGLGRALLGHAVGRSRAAGHDVMGLAVTVGNPARRLYDAAGFVEDRTTLAVLMPKGS